MIKHKLLAARPELRPYLPETHWLTAERAVRMLKSYRLIFIKPDGGSGGTGIFKVIRTGNGYKLLNGQIRKDIHSTDSLLRLFKTYEKSSNKYIVQKGLSLARYKGTIFDVRMYLQKPYSEWIVSGKVARVAARNRYVTNYHLGGHAEPLNNVLLELFEDNKKKVDDCLEELEDASIIVAETLEKRFADIRELGIDMGIDKKGHVWFIEANSRPMHRLFTQLPDKTMLETIRKNKEIINDSEQNS